MSVAMGRTNLSKEALDELMPLLRSKWPGWSYDTVRRNCHHFTDFFCQVLGFPSGPKFGIFGAGDAGLAASAHLRMDETATSNEPCCLCLPASSQQQPIVDKLQHFNVNAGSP